MSLEDEMLLSSLVCSGAEAQLPEGPLSSSPRSFPPLSREILTIKIFVAQGRGTERGGGGGGRREKRRQATRRRGD